MPPRSTPGQVDLALDIQALGHLVTRREIAGVLWTRKPRKSLENALRTIYGDRSFAYLERSVSKHLVLSRINLLPDLLERVYDQNNDQRANQILAIVQEIMCATSLEFQEEFVHLLLQAAIQACLQVLIQAEQDFLGDAYRTTVDLIRNLFDESKGSSCVAFKKTGVKLVKDVVTILTQSGKENALRRADKFLVKYSPKNTAHYLQEQANMLAEDLPPLTLKQAYLQATSDAHRADPSRQRGKRRKRRPLPVDKPDFFSDDSDETSNVTPDEESVLPDDSRKTATKAVRDEFDSEALSASPQDTPRPPRKRARRSRENDRDVTADGLENGARQGRVLTPVSRSRGRRYPQLEEELDGMESPMFSETRPPPERVDHVVRYAKSKRRKRGVRPDAKGRRSGTRQRSPISISREESSPTYRGKSDPQRDDSSDDEGHPDKGIDTDEENAMDHMGREGTVLQDLRATATKLQKAGPKDPLKESVRDAKRARHRKSRSDPTYSPAPGARGASPLPDSDDDSGLPRKKVTRVQLGKSPPGQGSKKPRKASAVPGTGGMMFGKTCRTGRFEPFEDDQLHTGLQALGWGAWTEIAREYWDGDYTRAPSSLKDRARTLGLGPHRYPRRMELRGRPRLAGNLDEHGGSPRAENPRHTDEDEDRDEDIIEEDDEIEANGTPGAGDGEAEA